MTKQGKEAEIKKENELSEKWTERRAKERETERQEAKIENSDRKETKKRKRDLHWDLLVSTTCQHLFQIQVHQSKRS